MRRSNETAVPGREPYWALPLSGKASLGRDLVPVQLTTANLATAIVTLASVFDLATTRTTGRLASLITHVLRQIPPIAI